MNFLELCTFKNYSEMSSDSVTSSESVDTQQVVDLQGAILLKSQQIEAFITRMRKNNGKSDTFQFLETLFALFKSEVQVNISLRRALLKQQQDYTDEINAIKEQLNPKPFFDELSRISQRDICDFNCALDLFSEISSIFLEAKEKLKSKLKDAKDDNVKLIQYGKEMESQFEQLENQIQEQENANSELQSKLTEATDYIEGLKSALNDSNQKLEQIQKENENLKKAEEQSKASLQQKVDFLSKTLQTLRAELNDVTEQLQTHQVQLAYETSQTEAANNKLNNEKNENEKLLAALQKLSKKEQGKKKVISELKKEVARLQDVLNERETEFKKYHQKEMSDLKKKFETSINAKIDDIEAAIKDKDDKLQILKANYEDASRKLEKAEQRAREQQQITLRYKAENERLREKMRQQNPRH